MSSLGVYVALAAISPLFAASIPLLISKFKKELPTWVPFCLLGLSSGMLFAVATLDLIPEGIGMAIKQTNEEWNPNFVIETSEYEDHEPASPQILFNKLIFINL